MGCRERQRLLELRLDTISHHWRLHRLLDPAPLQGRGPTADQRLIAVVVTAVLVLLAFALAAHLQAWGS